MAKKLGDLQLHQQFKGQIINRTIERNNRKRNTTVEDETKSKLDSFIKPTDMLFNGHKC